jgi:hypothetical protein
MCHPRCNTVVKHGILPLHTCCSTSTPSPTAAQATSLHRSYAYNVSKCSYDVMLMLGAHNTRSSAHRAHVMLQSKEQCVNILDAHGAGDAANACHRRASRITAQYSNPSHNTRRHSPCLQSSWFQATCSTTTAILQLSLHNRLLQTLSCKQHAAASNILFKLNPHP